MMADGKSNPPLPQDQDDSSQLEAVQNFTNSSSQNRKLTGVNIGPSLIGNILEFYDLGLYGFYAPLLYVKYFPDSHPFTKLLASFGIFAAGFIMRPLGAIIFGYVGDIYGRKTVLLFTLFLTAICSVLIGILPTYGQIGLYASMFLTVLRLIQGICTGGEYNTAAIFILEHTPQKHHGFLSGIITSTAISGFFISSMMAYVTSLEFMPDWAWRIPFILGGAAAIAGYKIRRFSYETDVFLNLGERNKYRIPLVMAFNKNKKAVVSTIGVGCLAGVLSLLIVGFLQSYLKDTLKVSSSLAYSLSHWGLLLYMASLPLYGHLSDRVGHRELMERGAFITLMVSAPLFFFLSSGSFYEMALSVTLLSLLAGAFLAPMHAYMFSIFSTEERCSGVSFSFSVGVALFGGTSPILSSLLIKWSGLLYAPSFYLMLSALVGFLSLRLLSPFEKETHLFHKFITQAYER